MPKILVNYKLDKKANAYKILENDVIYADMPIAVMDMYAEYDEILVVPINNMMTVVDKVEYLKVNKQFKLFAKEDGSVVEDNEKGTPIWLPRNTDLSKLKVVNGRLVLVEPKEEVVDSKEGE